MNAIKRRTITELLEEHASFIIPLLITYVFGLLFAFITYYGNSGNAWSGDSEKLYMSFFKVSLDSMVPTTITYVLTEAIHNFVSFYRRKTGHYIWTVFTLISVGIYEIIFLLYTMTVSTIWVWAVCVFTLLLLFLNALSYRDYYLATNRGHGLV